MASSRINPFPIDGWVPYRDALYSVVGHEVFRGGRLYHLVRTADGLDDHRLLVNHWHLLDNMQRLARFHVGDRVLHEALGEVRIIARAWRFSVGRVVYGVRGGAAHPHACFDDALAPLGPARAAGVKEEKALHAAHDRA